MAKHFDLLVHKRDTRTCRSEALTSSMTERFAFDRLRILNKLWAFAGKPLCCAVCTTCFEKCTYCFANVEDDLRNAPKRLRKTVMSFICWGLLGADRKSVV